jgi:Rrf2 family transcriptional regulator, nitric oxide-sensitive transcriptional repressor
MRLTKFSDYAFRMLLLAADRKGGKTTVSDAARLYGISESHVKKVVRHLIHVGWLAGSRGRGGGFWLTRPPEQISLGDVLRQCEPDFGWFACMVPDGGCAIAGPCRLPGVAEQALAAFLAAYDRYTLADVLLKPEIFPDLDRQSRQAPR